MTEESVSQVGEVPPEAKREENATTEGTSAPHVDSTVVDTMGNKGNSDIEVQTDSSAIANEDFALHTDDVETVPVAKASSCPYERTDSAPEQQQSTCETVVEKPEESDTLEQHSTSTIIILNDKIDEVNAEIPEKLSEIGIGHCGEGDHAEQEDDAVAFMQSEAVVFHSESETENTVNQDQDDKVSHTGAEDGSVLVEPSHHVELENASCIPEAYSTPFCNGVVVQEEKPQERSGDAFYTNAAEYWGTVPANIEGMLGGFGHISSTDIGSSFRFLRSFIIVS